jgi:nitroalkane oxidase
MQIYDGGNMGMQRRRVHGIIVHEDVNPYAIMDDDFVEFHKSMEPIGTVAALQRGSPGLGDRRRRRSRHP